MCLFGSPVTGTRSPSVNQGYFARALAIESTFEKTLINLTLEGNDFQVLSCGAGFDTTYFRLRNAGILTDKCRYFEVDYPKVAGEKSRNILKNPVLINLCLQNFPKSLKMDSRKNLRIGNYTIFGCDLTRTNELEAMLSKFGFDFSMPTVILCECSLTYIQSDKATSIYRWMAAKIKDAHLIIYEQIRPNDRFGRIMKKHFSDRASPLLNIDDYPTLFDQERRLKMIGFRSTRSMSLVDIIYKHYGESEKAKRKILEPFFDEMEELFQKCAHYSVLEGFTIPQLDVQNQNEINFDLRPVMKTNVLQCSSAFRRFGHLCFLNNDEIVLFGGNSTLGGRDNILAKFPSNSLTSKTNSKSILMTKTNTFAAGCQLKKEPNIVIVFGGRSSPLDATNGMIKIDLDSLNQEEINPDNETCVPNARWKHTMSETESGLVVIGGKNHEKVFSDISEFSLETLTWNKRNELEIGLFSHSAAVYKSTIIITGGLNEQEQINEFIFVLDTRSNDIRKFKFPDLLPRFSHQSVIHNNHLFLIGGISKQYQPGLAVLSLEPELNLIREYHLDIPRSIGLYNNSITIQNGKILCFGGGGNCFSFGMHIGTEVLQIDLQRDWR